MDSGICYVIRGTCRTSVQTFIFQFMDLRTRYTALVTLMTQYVKFASETLKRTEEEEVRGVLNFVINLNKMDKLDVA